MNNKKNRRKITSSKALGAITIRDCKFRSIFLLLLILLSGVCAAQQIEKNGKTGNVDVNVKLDNDASTFQLIIRRSGDIMDWKADTLAIVTYWDSKNSEQTKAICSSSGWNVEQKSVGQGYQLKCRQQDLGFSFNIIFSSKDDVVTVSVPSSDVLEKGSAKLKSIRLLPYFGAAKEGTEGYLTIAKEIGALCHFKDKKAEEYTLPIYEVNDITMPLFGMVHGTSGVAGIVTNGQYNCQICINTNWGVQHQYSIDPEFNLRSFKDEKRLSDDLIVEYHFLPSNEADWLGIAKRYRKYNFTNRDIRPLRQRVAESSELAYASQSLEVRLRIGVKPVPVKVLEQTPETEPPVRVFLTFERVRDIFNEFHLQGIDQTEFCLVGWHSRGHDGRFPQLFPVEPAFGGENELRKTISYGQGLGYQIVSHDCYDDAYRISKDWDEEYIRKSADGQLLKGGKLAGGQSYKPCRIRAYELFAKRDEPRVRNLGFKGLHYNDVLSIVGPKPCYDPNHPATRRQDAEATNLILALSRKVFGGVQSEGPLDFTAPFLDRELYISIHGQGDQNRLKDLPYVDTIIPLYSAVYHGTLLYTISNDCVNSQPGTIEYLRNIEYGGMPLAYFYGHFSLDPSKEWLGSHDLRYDSKDGLKVAVAGLKPVYDDLQKLKHLQMEFIEAHRQLAEGVFETSYSNGQSVVVNYNNEPYRIVSGEEIPAKGFVLTNQK